MGFGLKKLFLMSAFGAALTSCDHRTPQQKIAAAYTDSVNNVLQKAMTGVQRATDDCLLQKNPGSARATFEQGLDSVVTAHTACVQQSGRSLTESQDFDDDAYEVDTYLLYVMKNGKVVDSIVAKSPPMNFDIE